MPSEVKQRRKPQKPDDSPETNSQDKEQKVKTAAGTEERSHYFDFKSISCILSLTACAALSWLVLQQNERFSEMEEKFHLLHTKTSPLIAMEAELQKVSEKLAASEDDLQEALSSVSMATGLRQDLSALHAVVASIRADEDSASHHLQEVNAHFLNVTEAWERNLGLINSDLASLKAESRDAHALATEKVNEAERRAKSLQERLEELEDSTKRNARALERTEGDDVKRAQDHLDWNSKQIQKLQDHLSTLSQSEAQLRTQLQEHIPKAEECERHLPRVEEAVRSTVRLASDLSAAEKRLEELTLQVLGSEDSLLKALGEILQIRQELDKLHAKNSLLKMKDELAVVKEAVRELTQVLRQGQDQDQHQDQHQDQGQDQEQEQDQEHGPEEEEDWTNEEDEPWEQESDDLTEQ